MFAYCNNNPISKRDTHGASFTISMSIVVGGTILGLIALTGIMTAPGFQEACKDATEAIADTIKEVKEKTEIYTVYMLTDASDPNGGVVYVGRVKTANYKARMAYHESVGRSECARIDGLNYAQCRGLEQILMAYYHTLRQGEKLFNQIRGVSQSNKNGVLYTLAGLEYLTNQVENEYLNLPMAK